MNDLKSSSNSYNHGNTSDYFSEHLPEKSKYIPFATKEQLLDWYRRYNGENIVRQCTESKNYKLAWKDYTTQFNRENEKTLGWRLHTSVDGIIQAFGIKKYNVFNFTKLLSGESPDEGGDASEKKRGCATVERLQEWYQERGIEIVETCKKSDNPGRVWKFYTEAFNKEYALKNGWYLPTTIKGIIAVFGVHTCSIFNFVSLLSGRALTEEEMNSGNRKLHATKTQLLQWYQDAGKSVIQACRESGNFAKTWREYVGRYNKEDFYTTGFRLPNNKVGLVTTLGGTDYTIPEIVRLLEGLPEGTRIPKIQKEVKSKIMTTIDPEKEKLRQLRKKHDEVILDEDSQ